MPDVHMSIEKKSKPEAVVQSKKSSENDDENNNITENSEQNTWKELDYLEDQVDLERNPFV